MSSLKNTTIDTTDAILLPRGTTAQRPASPVVGDLRYNTSLNIVEYFNGSWFYLPSIIDSGLVLRLDAAEPASYPGSGNFWYDLSGQGNHVTLSNVTFDSANGGGMVFNGSTSTSSFNSVNINFSAQQTIVLVLRPEEADAARRNPYNQAYAGYGTITHEPDNTFNYYWGTGGADNSPYSGFNSSFGVAQNEIAMIILTRKLNTLSWYKNGVLFNYITNPYPATASIINTTLIGDGYAGKYLGKIYSVLLYTRALSAAEVAHTFNVYRGRYGL